MKKYAFAVLIYPLITLSGHANESPPSLVKHFYDWRFNAKFTGLPTDDTLKKSSAFLSPELTCLLDRARTYRDLFAKKFPTDKPPFIEGDMFTSQFEGANRYSLEKTYVNGANATIRLHFFLDRGKLADKKGWRDTLYLQYTNRQWRISDIQYGGDFDFGNSGSLRKNLLEELANDNEEIHWDAKKQLELCR